MTDRGNAVRKGEDKAMTIHEFGKENTENILLLHPSVVRWDYFEYVIPLLEKVFSTDDYSKEDIRYVAEILKQSLGFCRSWVMPGWSYQNRNCLRVW